MPKELSRVVEKEMQKGKFASKSEFFRNLIRLWEEGKLFSDLQESEKEFAAGRGKKLRSLAGLR